MPNPTTDSRIRLQLARRPSRQFKLPAIPATTARARRTSIVPPAQHLASLLFSCCFVYPTLLTHLQFPLAMIHALAGANPSWSILPLCVLNGLIRPLRTPPPFSFWEEGGGGGATPRRPRAGDRCTRGRSICTLYVWPYMSQSRISRMEMPSADTPKPAKSHTSSAKVVRTAGLPRGAPRKHLQPRRAYGMTYKPPISLGCKLTQGHPRKAGTSKDIHQLFVVPARRRNCFPPSRTI